MRERTTQLAAFTTAIVEGRADLFAPLVKSAYGEGAWHSDLLTAVDIARALGPVAPRVVTRAYAAVNDWRWIEARRTRGTAEPVPPMG
jgi:hypothetical protein